VCIACDGPYVSPIAQDVSEGEWHLMLRCGQCRAERLVKVSDDDARRFSDAIARFSEDIRSELNRLEKEKA
jgi:hypothetical protein